MALSPPGLIPIPPPIVCATGGGGGAVVGGARGGDWTEGGFCNDAAEEGGSQ